MEPKLAIAVDLGGTQYRVAVVERSGRFRVRIRRPSRPDLDAHTLVGDIAATIHESLGRVSADPSQIVGVGIGAPGTVDPVSGCVLEAPNLPAWRNVPLRDLLVEALGLTTLVGNDANLAALGEYWFGAGRGSRHLVYLTVSTGIGGGVIIDGRLLLGAHGLAAEFGHVTVLPNGPLCGCGNHGCLESVASGPAIVREAAARLAAGAESPALRRLDPPGSGSPGELTTAAIATAARAGDALAIEVFQTATSFLGLGVAALVHTFDPDVIVVGGGVSLSGPFFFQQISTEAERRVMASYRGKFRIVPAALGDDVGLAGAAALVFMTVAGSQPGG